MLKPFELKKVTSIIKQYSTSGHSPYLVLTEDLDQYVLKAPLNSNGKPSIIKEFLCSQLLSIWGIRAPKAVTLCLSKDLLSSEPVQKNKALQIPKTFFGSQYAQNSIDLQNFIGLKTKAGQSKIINIEALIDIALFDIWIENDDRRPSNNNIILCPTQKQLQIVPIDNAFTFATLNFNSLSSENLTFSYNDSILYSPLGFYVRGLIKKNLELLSIAEEKFYLCIQRAEDNFIRICDCLPADYKLTDNESACLKAFLFSSVRKKKVLELFKSIVFTAK